MTKVWMITGSSRGLGRALAEAVLAADDSLAATARDPAQLQDLVSRYGDFILLKPPFKPETTLLWLSPALVLAAGLAATLYARRRAPRSTRRLSAEEEARLSSLTGGDAGHG